MKFYRVEFVHANGREDFEIVEAPTDIAAETIVKLKHFRCVIFRTVRL